MPPNYHFKMNLKTPFIYTPIKFGVTGAVLFITMFLASYFSSANPLLENNGIVDVLILLIFLFLAIKEYRDTFNNKLLEFWQGMTLGFICYVIIAVITSLFILFFVTVINPDVLDTYVVSMLENLENEKESFIERMGEESYRETLTVNKNTSIWKVVLDNFEKKTIIGLALTIVISVIMKSKPKTEAND